MIYNVIYFSTARARSINQRHTEIQDPNGIVSFFRVIMNEVVLYLTKKNLDSWTLPQFIYEPTLEKIISKNANANEDATFLLIKACPQRSFRSFNYVYV